MQTGCWRYTMGDKCNCDKCFECGGECCKSVAIRVDEPEDVDDYLDFKWYLFHPGLTVYLDTEGDWHVDVPIKCRHLTKDGRCRIYEERPPVCRDYDVDECDNGDDTVVTFEKPEDVDRYIAKLRARGEL